jgi:hypothetical protein
MGAPGSLKNTPDSEENAIRSGNVTEIQATARPKDESMGSSASRFGNAKAAMSARRFICGDSWWTLSVTVSSIIDSGALGPCSGMVNSPRLSKSASVVPPKPRWSKRTRA